MINWRTWKRGSRSWREWQENLWKTISTIIKLNVGEISIRQNLELDIHLNKTFWNTRYLLHLSNQPTQIKAWEQKWTFFIQSSYKVAFSRKFCFPWSLGRVKCFSPLKFCPFHSLKKEEISINSRSNVKEVSLEIE